MSPPLYLMKQLSRVFLAFVFGLQACAGASTAGPRPTTTPTAARPTAPAPTTGTAAAGAPAATPLPTLKRLTEAPEDWQRLSADKDGVFGVGSERAMSELLQGQTPARRILVAVIDGGIDTAHTMLKANIWRNSREVLDGKDDDGDGLIDDIMGWNYVGGSNLRSVNNETFEVTRLYAACQGKAAGAGTPKPDATRCTVLGNDYDKKRQEVASQLGQINDLIETTNAVSDVLKRSLGTTTLTHDRVSALQPNSQQVAQARSIWLQIEAAGLMGAAAEDAKAETEAQLRVGLDLENNARIIVGDDVGNLSQRVYGNRDVMGPDAKHGTHVAGIIGAIRDGGKMEGIAASVQIMAVRAVPNGDERDKDIANAIRYAVDHGAQIINMSFGKPYSPGKSAVDAAARYAESKGVLMIHAAGNDGENIDVTPSFPSAVLEDQSRIATWIEVGASSWKGLDELSASFSNYGKTRVDIFAPGVDILSTVPGGGTARLSGTSMAAPVVSGVAALLMSYFPTLSASDTKDILMQSARRINMRVEKPGDAGGQIAFGELSRTGAVVDAYAAVKLAQARALTK